jgi:hypothetical protein
VGQPQHRQDLLAVLHDLAVADPLDALHRELLEPGDHVQRDRHPPLPHAGDEQAVDGRRGGRPGGVLLRLGPLDLVGGEVGPAGEARDVQDQRHRAVAEQGRPGVDADVLEPGGQRLDHRPPRC